MNFLRDILKLPVPKILGYSLQRPSLPDGFDSMGMEEQRIAKAAFQLEQANLYYTAATGVHNRSHKDILRTSHLGMKQYVLRQTGFPFDADVINLRALLVGITTPWVWESISAAECPVVFSDEERESAMAESKTWNETEELLAFVRDYIGIDGEGGTEVENFEWAVRGNDQLPREMVKEAEVGQKDIHRANWPYKDDGDCSLAPGISRIVRDFEKYSDNGELLPKHRVTRIVKYTSQKFGT